MALQGPDSPRLPLCLCGLGQDTPEADSEWKILEKRRAVEWPVTFTGAVWGGNVLLG